MSAPNALLSSDGSNELPLAAREFVLLRHEASVRGFKNALGFKRFCLRIGVPIYKVGKLLFVKTSEVDTAIGRGATRKAPSPSDDNVQRAVDMLTHRRSR